MRQDSRPVLKIHTRNDEPGGLSCLRRLAIAAKETEPELAEWLEQAVTDVESGANPKTALSLARRRGRPTASNKDEWKQIAVGVRVSRLREDGLSYEKAVAQVAKERFLSESSVKRCFRKYRPFKQLQDAAEETFGSFKRALDVLAAGLRHAEISRSVAPRWLWSGTQGIPPINAAIVTVSQLRDEIARR